HVATDHEELGLYYRLTRKELAHTFLADIGSSDRSHTVIIQQCLSGDEYGLDVVNDLDGNHVCTFVKRKLAMRGGETDRAITVRHHALEALGERLGRALGHIGNLDCDVFMHGDQPVVLELNPRFGGGYPFSHIAGANLPAALVAWANGLDVDPLWFDIKPGVVASKYSELVVANPQNILYQE
ncbi:MAG TPA: ATP-grasp domain-containing protein, partial [Chloroflexi bacterium]|nr:ATP-grasp domain-containing protein [Chloroflexota bacterium]